MITFQPLLFSSSLAFFILPPLAHRLSTNSREEEEEDAQACPCGKAVESRTHTVGECEIYKEERGVFEEMRKLDECGMEKFGALLIDGSEKTVAILQWEINGGHRRRNRKDVKYEKQFLT